MKTAVIGIIAVAAALAPGRAAPLPIFPQPREFQATGATFELDSSVVILVPATPRTTCRWRDFSPPS